MSTFLKALLEFLSRWNSNPAGEQQPGKDQKFDFSSWFTKQSLELKTTFTLLIGAVPLTLFSSIFSERFWTIDITDPNSQVGLFCILVQFGLICYLLYQLLKTISTDRNDAWKKLPSKLVEAESDPANKKLLVALNFYKGRGQDPDELKEHYEDVVKHAIKSETYFKVAWVSAWVVWLLIYVVQALAEINILRGLGDSSFLQISHNLFLCLLILAFAFCYYILSAGDHKDGSNSKGSTWWFFLVGLGMTVFFIVVSCYHAEVETDLKTFQTILVSAKILMHVLLGVFFSLTVSKLLSNDLGSPNWLKFTLFFYAILIPLFGVFADDQYISHYIRNTHETVGVFHNFKYIFRNIELGLFNLVLIAKFSLFLFVMWLLDKDHLLFYFLRYRGSYYEIVEHRLSVEEFLQENSKSVT